ncbi:hypothetical protein ACXC9Q_00465 [Kribbella sp. CWNU-51]
MPKLKLGAVVYGLVAVGLAVGVVLTLRHYGAYVEVHGAPLAATVVVLAATALLLAVGAVTRRGLVADDGPWICRHGWIVLFGLTAAGWVVAFLGNQDVPMWPTGPAAFLPHFIRRLQESYYDGVAEAERGLRAEPDEVRGPGS